MSAILDPEEKTPADELLRRYIEARKQETMRVLGLDSEEAVEAYLRAEQEKKHLDAVRATGIPEKFWNVRFETSDPTSAVHRMRRYIEHGELKRGRALVMVGPVGSGKTWALGCAVNALVPEVGVAFWYMPRLIERWHSDERDAVMDRVLKAEVLMLDDMGVEAMLSDLTRDFLDTLFYMRHAKSLATIVTTNLSAEAFAARYGERITDRLREWGAWFPIRILGSLRATIASP